jgi:hypothetical protein
MTDLAGGFCSFLVSAIASAAWRGLAPTPPETLDQKRGRVLGFEFQFKIRSYERDRSEVGGRLRATISCRRFSSVAGADEAMSAARCSLP